MLVTSSCLKCDVKSAAGTVWAPTCFVYHGPDKLLHILQDQGPTSEPAVWQQMGNGGRALRVKWRLLPGRPCYLRLSPRNHREIERQLMYLTHWSEGGGGTPWENHDAGRFVFSGIFPSAFSLVTILIILALPSSLEHEWHPPWFPSRLYSSLNPSSYISTLFL